MPDSQTDMSARGVGRLVLIGGWACLGIGLVLLRLSLNLELVLIPPLFVAALVLGFIATIRASRIGGALLLLLTVVAPAILLSNRDSETALPEHRASREASADPVVTRRQAPAAGEPLARRGTAPARRPAGTQARRPVRRTPTLRAVASPPETRAPLQRPASHSSPAAAHIPEGLPDLEVIDMASSQRPATQNDRAAVVDAPPEQETDGDAWDFLDDPIESLPFVGREVGDVLKAPPVEESQTNAGIHVGGRHMYTDETNMYGNAWVRNNGTGTVDTVPLLVLWFDTNANIIATSRANVRTLGGIERGKTLNFGIMTRGDPRIAGYHYIVLP